MNINEARYNLSKLGIAHSNLPGKVVIKDCVTYFLETREAQFHEGLNDHPQKDEIINIFTSLTINDAGLTYYLIDAYGSIIVFDRVESKYVLGNTKFDDLRYVKSFPEKAFEFMDFDLSHYHRLASYHGWEKHIKEDGRFNMSVLEFYFGT